MDSHLNRFSEAIQMSIQIYVSGKNEKYINICFYFFVGVGRWRGWVGGGGESTCILVLWDQKKVASHVKY